MGTNLPLGCTPTCCRQIGRRTQPCLGRLSPRTYKPCFPCWSRSDARPILPRVCVLSQTNHNLVAISLCTRTEKTTTRQSERRSEQLIHTLSRGLPYFNLIAIHMRELRHVYRHKRTIAFIVLSGCVHTERECSTGGIRILKVSTPTFWK